MKLLLASLVRWHKPDTHFNAQISNLNYIASLYIANIRNRILIATLEKFSTYVKICRILQIINPSISKLNLCMTIASPVSKITLKSIF